MAQTIPEDFRVDISHEQSFRYLQAKQFDHNSRIRRLIITDNNIPIQYTGHELVTLSLWVNGENYSNTTCHFREDGYPYIEFTESMLSRQGDVACELRIFDSNEESVITPFNFTMTVSRSLLNHDRLVASSEFNILNDLILQANTIPDLIKEFGSSQEEINKLIEKIESDIASYTNQFSAMKTTYTNDFNTLLSQINTDITSYQTEYNSLKSDIANFKTDVTNWYTSAQAAENARVTAEEKRQIDTNAAITRIDTAKDKAIQDVNNAISAVNISKANTEQATLEAKNATKDTISAGLYAQNQGDKVDAAIQGLQYTIVELDGGNAFVTDEDYTSTYDGGGA